ncbi:MAG TPA: MG2 domain-containing protein, partial [Vicinamibacteria bacterium]
GGREDYDPWDRVYSYSRLEWARSEDDVYSTGLPELLHARTTYRLRADRSSLLDEFGRPLPRDIDFIFTTSDRPPRLALTHPISTLEKNVETRVPAVVTNLDALDLDVEALTADGVEARSETLSIPKAPNVAFRYPLPTREWLHGKSGALFANASSRPETVTYEDRLFSQVTPFAVHTKFGHQNTAVWVTDMSTGLPVEGASVFIYRALPVNALREREPLSQAITDATGVALLAGQAELNPLLEIERWQNLANRDAGETFFVSVEKNGELALAPLSSDFWVYIEGTNSTWIPSAARTRYGHVRAWGTTAQGVYRLGDTIQYKLYVRDQSNERFVKAPNATYHLQVFDPMEKMVHEETDVELNAFGALDGEFRVAESGAVGWYRFQLSSSFHNETWEPLRVLVADFTPAPFRVTTDLDAERYEPGDMIRVATSAKLHSGGPYADADSRITVNVTPTSVTTENPKATGFWFGSTYGETVTVHQSEAPVNTEGELETTVPVLDQAFPRGRLLIESAVRDDRGKYIAGRATANYLGRDRFVGIRQEGWLLKSGEPSEVQAIVLDTKDEVASGTDVTLRVQYRETTASRVKGAGNAYITQYNYEWVDVATCSETSGMEPTRCRFTPEKPGYYRLTAAIVDSKGRPYEVSTERWAAGKGQVLWEESPGNRLDIEPEKKEYRVGETARFLVRNPFPGAKALVTLERYGVQRHWIEALDESTKVIEVQVGEDHVPGFYLSVVATSPRVEAPPSEDDLDLGKPAFRMGYVRVPVVDPVKEITVDVHPQKDLYKPRDKVKVELRARPRQWASTSLPPMELAVAVLDEAVFDLIGGGDAYFDPYRGFYSLEPLDVENFNLLTRLIGIQKFEKKGASPGGDGGGGPDLRTLFKFVSYWNPALVPDAEGRATIEFEVPDNLTGWRILTMAVTPEDRMGLGQGH